MQKAKVQISAQILLNFQGIVKKIVIHTECSILKIAKLRLTISAKREDIDSENVINDSAGIPVALRTITLKF